MIEFLLWYLLVSLLGLITFPVAFRLLPALADRGYAFSRAFGLLLWGYIFWMLASLGFINNNPGGLLFTLLAVLGLGLWAGRGSFREPLAWLKGNRPIVFTVEVLFLLAFAAWAFVRAANPDIAGTEKPMEMAFINAILRSETFPPHDPWLAGYAISYYYFGYVLAAMLAGLTGTPGAIAFNLMLALVFALGATGAFGLLFNLLSAHWAGKTTRALGFSLLGPLFLLLLSNWQGFLEVLHKRGLFWEFAPDGSAQSAFWTWLGIRDLNSAPLQPLGWVPDRYWWWWRASRVLQDYDFAGNFSEVIDEFPFFSFLLGDLHPHVLAIPFGLLAAGLALHLYLRNEMPEIRLFGLVIPLGGLDLAVYGLTLGGLAFLNTWDFPIYLALTLGALALARIHKLGWGWHVLEAVLLAAIPLGVVSILLYLPFYVGFSSQAGGILPNLVHPTRAVYQWIMFGPLLLALFVLFGLFRRQPVNHRAGWLAGFGFVVLLWLFSILLAALASNTPTGQQLIAMQGMADFMQLLDRSLLQRFITLPTLLTLGAILSLALAHLTATQAGGKPAGQGRSPLPVVMLFILVGGLLVLAPEFVYLRDQFGTRMNTVFKFYYQAWILWSLAAAFGVAVLFGERHSLPWWLARVLVLAGLLMGLFYPALSLPNKTNGFAPSGGLTLDGSIFLSRYSPDDYQAIQFLRTQPAGVVAEAVGGSYSEFARMATFSGQPNVLGWPGHEGQWRGGGEEMGSRMQDIELLYNTPDWFTANDILQRYNVTYVVVGTLERFTYQVEEDKFAQNLREVFRQGVVVVYQVP